MEAAPRTSRPASRLAAVRRRIDAWRSTCAGPQGRMPEGLWREAVLVAGELGAERVASSLGLSRSALERRLRTLARTNVVPDRPVFLEVTAALAPSAPLVLEIVARDGTRLRLEGPLAEIRGLVLSVVDHAP